MKGSASESEVCAGRQPVLMTELACRWSPTSALERAPIEQTKTARRLPATPFQNNRVLKLSSAGAQVHGLRALAHAVGFDVEGHLLTVDQSAQAGLLDCRDVHEDVLRAAI